MQRIECDFDFSQSRLRQKGRRIWQKRRVFRNCAWQVLLRGITQKLECFFGVTPMMISPITHGSRIIMHCAKSAPQVSRTCGQHHFAEETEISFQQPKDESDCFAIAEYSIWGNNAFAGTSKKSFDSRVLVQNWLANVFWLQ